jgi:hypothetical protein
MKRIQEVINKLLSYFNQRSASDIKIEQLQYEQAICFYCENRECECDDDELYFNF